MDNNTLPPNTIELVQRQFNRTPAQQRILRWLVAVGIVLLAMTIASIIFIFEPALPRNTGWLDMLKKAADKPFEFYLQLLLGVVAILFLTWQKKESLFLDQQGMRYISPLPHWLQVFRKSWQLEWSNLQRVSLLPSKFSPRADTTALLFQAGLSRHKILPGHWVIRGLATSAAEQGSIWHNLNSKCNNVALLDTPVMRYLKGLGIKIENESEFFRTSHLFAIENNSHTLLTVILFFMVGAYALVDGLFVHDEIYASRPPYEIFVSVGILIALTVSLWLSRAHIPQPESFVLAILLGCSAGAASYPGLLRLNQLSDKNGLVTYEYVLQENMSFRPNNAALPLLRFDHFHDYWRYHGVGSLHQFELRRGGLNFYQLDMGPIYRDMKNYYKKENSG